MEAAVSDFEAHPIANSAVCGAGSLEDAPQGVRICLVPVELVSVMVEEVAGWIEQAVASAPEVREPMAVVRERLEAGRYRLMLAGIGEKCYAAAVLEVVERAGGPCLFVVAAGGAIGNAFSTVGPQLWRGILGWARELGICVRLVGRPGWARWCARHGAGVKVKVTRILLEAR